MRYASAVEPYPTTSARILSCAPRASACSNVSRITIPAPSPSTNPPPAPHPTPPPRPPRDLIRHPPPAPLPPHPIPPPPSQTHRPTIQPRRPPSLHASRQRKLGIPPRILMRPRIRHMLRQPEVLDLRA